MHNIRHIKQLAFFAMLQLIIAVTAHASISHEQLSTELPVLFSLTPYSVEADSAKPDNTGNDNTAITSGTILELRITPQNNYLIYANDNGEAGRPLEITPDQTDSAVTAYYPAGTPKPDLFDATKTAKVHSKPATILVHVKNPETKQLSLSVSLLLCSDKNCRPVLTKLNADWNQAPLPSVKNQPWWPIAAHYTPVELHSIVDEQTQQAKTFIEAARKLQVELPSATTAKGLGAASSTNKLPEPTTGSAANSVTNLNSATDTTSNVTTLRPAAPLSASSQTLSTPTSARNSAVSLLSPSNTSKQSGVANTSAIQSPAHTTGYQFTPRYFLQALEVTSLGKALLLGLLAGFILNFMPCVLPVISLKLSSLLTSSVETDDAKRIATFREHNIFFALGIMVWFSCLAAILTAAGLAWGQLFQKEWVLFGLTTVVFGLGLSAFGVFHLPMLSITPAASGASVGASGKRSAFSTGLLATLLATPCSGPFLGGVLGWAFLQPPLVLAATFMAIGLGMSLPYLILAAFPGLARLLPKAGSWTGILSVLVGFFLMGTAAYLLSLLPAAKLPSMLLVLWVTALCAWTWGRFGGLNASRWRRRIVGTLCLLALTLTAGLALRSTTTEAPWQPYDKAEFMASIGKRPMMVDFTADWCPNCKVLEHTVLTPSNRAKWAEKYGITFIQVDMTRMNADKQALLSSLGASSIPVVAIFPAGADATSPVVLRDIFTTTQAEGALKDALGE